MKALFLSCIIMLCFSTTGLAQKRQKELDSLIKVVNALPKSIEKAQILGRIHERMMFTDSELARKYATEGFELSKKIKYAKGIANGYLQFGNYFYNRSENDSALYFYKLSLDKFKEMNSIRGQIFANHSIAGIERDNGNYDIAIDITKTNIALYSPENREGTDLKKFNLIGSEHEVLGSIYMDKGSFILAVIETLNALRFFEEIGDKVREGDALLQLGKIEYAQENFNSSLEYCKRAFEIYRDEDDKVYQSYAANAAGLASEALENFELAEDYQNQSISLAREMGVKSALSTSLTDMGRIYRTKKQFQDAEKLLSEALQIAEKTNIKLDIASTLKEMALLGMDTNAYPAALQKINEVIAIAKPIGAKAILRTAYQNRAKIYQELNNNIEALQDLEMFHQLNDSIYNSTKTQQIEELKTIYETEKKETEIELQHKEIKTLNQEVEINNLKKGLYAGGMFSFIAVSGVLFFGFKQRIKKNKIAREKQEEIYKQEIEHKKKELASETLHLVQKNTFIQELMNNLERIKKSPNLFKIEFRRIVMLLKKETASDKDWEIFKSYFADVHNDFDQKLKTIYTEISEKEIRLAAFLRMNLTTKEIAATLNVMPDSVLKSKYRLKKKLELDKETDLNSFLNTL
ncbi:MAG: hypothetical protein COA50_10755 [Flavobacteriaceae bacterium]|nr:MAG: hypothetical protein COA50_10755 [Flavobacteriaceae bacterium]